VRFPETVNISPSKHRDTIHGGSQTLKHSTQNTKGEGTPSAFTALCMDYGGFIIIWGDIFILEFGRGIQYGHSNHFALTLTVGIIEGEMPKNGTI